MNKYDGAGISAVKYAVLNFILICTNLILLSTGPNGGGTGDREEGLDFYSLYWFCLVFVFLMYGIFSMTYGRAKKKIRILTALPFLFSSVCITGFILYSQSQKKNFYGEEGLFNDTGTRILAFNADMLVYLIYFFILFAVFIGILGMFSRVRIAITGLLLNLLLLVLHIYSLREWI